jgi:hypothetical protein
MMKILTSFFLFLAIPIIFLEIKTKPEISIYAAAFSQCDLTVDKIFESKYSVSSYFFGKYWFLRDIDISELDNKNYLVEVLFALSTLHPSACEQPVVEYLNKLSMVGYDYLGYRNEQGLTYIQAEVLVSNYVGVKWLIENNVYIDTPLLREDSPYHGQYILQIAESINAKNPSNNGKKIIAILEKHEKTLKKCQLVDSCP